MSVRPNLCKQNQFAKKSITSKFLQNQTLQAISPETMTPQLILKKEKLAILEKDLNLIHSEELEKRQQRIVNITNTSADEDYYTVMQKKPPCALSPPQKNSYDYLSVSKKESKQKYKTSQSNGPKCQKENSDQCHSSNLHHQYKSIDVRCKKIKQKKEELKKSPQNKHLFSQSKRQAHENKINQKSKQKSKKTRSRVRQAVAAEVTDSSFGSSQCNFDMIEIEEKIKFRESHALQPPFEKRRSSITNSLNQPSQVSELHGIISNDSKFQTLDQRSSQRKKNKDQIEKLHSEIKKDIYNDSIFANSQKRLSSSFDPQQQYNCAAPVYTEMSFDQRVEIMKKEKNYEMLEKKKSVRQCLQRFEKDFKRRQCTKKKQELLKQMEGLTEQKREKFLKEKASAICETFQQLGEGNIEILNEQEAESSQDKHLLAEQMQHFLKDQQFSESQYRLKQQHNCSLMKVTELDSEDTIKSNNNEANPKGKSQFIGEQSCIKKEMHESSHEQSSSLQVFATSSLNKTNCTTKSYRTVNSEQADAQYRRLMGLKRNEMARREEAKKLKDLQEEIQAIRFQKIRNKKHGKTSQRSIMAIVDKQDLQNNFRKERKEQLIQQKECRTQNYLETLFTPSITQSQKSQNMSISSWKREPISVFGRLQTDASMRQIRRKSRESDKSKISTIFDESHMSKASKSAGRDKLSKDNTRANYQTLQNKHSSLLKQMNNAIKPPKEEFQTQQSAEYQSTYGQSFHKSTDALDLTGNNMINVKSDEDSHFSKKVDSSKYQKYIDKLKISSPHQDLKSEAIHNQMNRDNDQSNRKIDDENERDIKLKNALEYFRQFEKASASEILGFQPRNHNF